MAIIGLAIGEVSITMIVRGCARSGVTASLVGGIYSAKYRSTDFTII